MSEAQSGTSFGLLTNGTSVIIFIALRGGAAFPPTTLSLQQKG